MSEIASVNPEILTSHSPIELVRVFDGGAEDRMPIEEIFDKEGLGNLRNKDFKAGLMGLLYENGGMTVRDLADLEHEHYVQSDSSRMARVLELVESSGWRVWDIHEDLATGRNVQKGEIVFVRMSGEVSGERKIAQMRKSLDMGSDVVRLRNVGKWGERSDLSREMHNKSKTDLRMERLSAVLGVDIDKRVSKKVQMLDSGEEYMQKRRELNNERRRLNRKRRKEENIIDFNDAGDIDVGDHRILEANNNLEDIGERLSKIRQEIKPHNSRLRERKSEIKEALMERHDRQRESAQVQVDESERARELGSVVKSLSKDIIKIVSDKEEVAAFRESVADFIDHMDRVIEGETFGELLSDLKEEGIIGDDVSVEDLQEVHDKTGFGRLVAWAKDRQKIKTSDAIRSWEEKRSALLQDPEALLAAPDDIVPAEIKRAVEFYVRGDEPQSPMEAAQIMLATSMYGGEVRVAALDPENYSDMSTLNSLENWLGERLSGENSHKSRKAGEQLMKIMENEISDDDWDPWADIMVNGDNDVGRRTGEQKKTIVAGGLYGLGKIIRRSGSGWTVSEVKADSDSGKRKMLMISNLQKATHALEKRRDVLGVDASAAVLYMKKTLNKYA